MIDAHRTSDRDEQLALVVDEFFDAVAEGETPEISYYLDRYPEIADKLKVVIPAMLVAEQNTSRAESTTFENTVSQQRQLGDFRILRQIGRGGMGVVYEAEQVSMKRRVALKVLPLAGLVDELKIHRFQNEVRAVAALNHPNIVPVYMVGQERGVHYYAMQLIHGRSVADVIDSLRQVANQGKALNGSSLSQFTQDSRPSEEPAIEVSVAESTEPPLNDLVPASEPGEIETSENKHTNRVETKAQAESSTLPNSSRREYFRSVAVLGRQVAAALQHVHDEGIIHRDIKPANLLLDGATKVYVADFGLARIESAAGVTMTGDLVGTLRYMAPEQALGKRVVVDCRGDVYSLGVTLYELLALRPAYLEEDRQRLLKQIAFEEPKKLRRIAPEIPVELETIVHKAMSKEAAQRYSTAESLALDLELYLENRPINAKPPTAVEVIGKWTRRNLVLTWSAIVTLSLVAITLVFSRFAIESERDAALEAEAQAGRELYVARMNLVYEAWGHGDRQLAQELLSQYGPVGDEEEDLRGFEWRFLWRLCQDESVKTLTTFGEEGAQSWYDSNLISFSADGTKLAIVEGKTVGVWGFDFDGHRELAAFEGHQRISALAFSPVENDVLAIGDADQIMMWNVASDSAPSTLASTKNVEALAFSLDGQRLASAGGWQSGRIKLWDVETSNLVSTSDLGHREVSPAGEETTTPALCVAFSPDGTLMASGGGDTHVRLWNAETGMQVGPPMEGHTAFVLSVAFSPDGQTIATAGIDGRILIWDVATQGLRLERHGHRGVVRSVEFSPDGKTLVSAGEDYTVRSWNTTTGEQTSILRGHTHEIHSVAFAPSGRTLVSSSNKSVKFWDAPTDVDPTVLTDHAGWLHRVELTPDGRLLATSDFHDQSVKLWDVRTRNLQGVLPGHTGWVHMAMSSNGKFLATGSWSDPTVRLWDVNSHQLVCAQKCGKSRTGSVSFSYDDRFLSATSPDGIKFWNTSSGDEVNLIGGDTRSVRGAVFSPCDEILAAFYAGGELIVWDTGDASIVTSFAGANGTDCICYSPNGRFIASRSDSSNITLFDVESGTTSTLDGHFHQVNSLAFSPDSKTLASASRDSTLRLWNVATGQTALTLQHVGPVNGVSFSSDGGQLMASCGADGTVRLWPAASLSEVGMNEPLKRE